jgi:hypothetical protein
MPAMTAVNAPLCPVPPRAAPKAVACDVPVPSRIQAFTAGADFMDAHVVEVLAPQRRAIEHLLVALQATPPWVERLMALRNRVVVWFGLRHAGDWRQALRPTGADWAPGDRVGIFTLHSIDDDEVIVGDDDHHLRVLLSLRRLPAGGGQPARVVISTVVHLHNTLGRLYMLPVTPAHRVIAPAVLARVNATLPA